MRIGAVYIHPNGTDWTGLDPLPLINIYDCSNNSLVINAASLAEIAEGGYKYVFVDYDPSKEYYWKIDGGEAIPTNLRYRRGWSGLAGAVPDAQAGVNGGLPTVDANNYIAGFPGTKNVLDDLNDLLAAQVNAQVIDVLKVDTTAEMSQGDPPEEATMEQMLNYLYHMWRNKTTATGSELAMWNSAGTTKLVKAVLTKVGSLFTKGKMGTGA